MTAHSKNLVSLHNSAKGKVSFGNKKEGTIVGTGVLRINEKVKVSDVSLVDNLGFNLLSISQICDQGNNVVTFSPK